VPDYRLAPERPFPAALEDVRASCLGLIESGLKKVAVTGDSAGGTLAFGLLAFLNSTVTMRAILSPRRPMEETGSLIRELTNVRMTAAGSGRVRMGAEGCGRHDDLVIALALACWRAKRGQNGFGTRRLTGI
jgi:hypothetical protein